MLLNNGTGSGHLKQPPDDLVEPGKEVDTNKYKYALGNENVINTHIIPN